VGARLLTVKVKGSLVSSTEFVTVTAIDPAVAISEELMVALT
jgi:hypothetical protein